MTISKLSFHEKFQEVLIWSVLALLIFVPRVTDLGLFLGPDEEMRNRQSLDSFRAIVEGRWGDVFSSNFGGTNLTWARTGAKILQFVWLHLQGVAISLSDMVNYGPQFDPLPGAIFNALIVLVIYWFARRLFDRKTAVLATVILAIDPNLLSESRILRTEAAFATFATLAMIGIAIYARTRQRRYLAWCGFWAAWTIATKISGVILAPIVGLALAGMVWAMRPTLSTTRRQLERLAIDLLIWSGVTIVCTFAIWPSLWGKPAETFAQLYGFVVGFGLTPKSRLVFFFMGETTQYLPPLYYLLILLYKTTPLVWLGLGAFAWAVWQSTKENREPREPTWAGVPFPLAGGAIVLLFGVVYPIVMSFGAAKSERYMMGPICTIEVAAAVGLVWLGERIYRKWQARQAALLPFWAMVFVVIGAGQGLFALLNHPYYFSYYNPLLGGGPSAVKMVQVGSGEVLDRAMNYLNNKPDPQKQVVVCGTNLPRCEYTSAGQTLLKRESFNALYADWIKADYVITYIFQTQRGDYDYPPGVIAYLEKHPGPEYTATFQGIDYAKVYPAPHAQYVAASQLTGISTLLGYDIDTQSLAAGETVKMKFYWESDGRIERDMFVQLTDTDDFIWSETTAPISPGFEGLRSQPEAIIEGQAELTTPAYMPPGRYYLKMGYMSEDGTLIGRFKLPAGGDAIEITLPGTFTSGPAPSHNLSFDLDGRLTLAGYDLDPESVARGATVWLALRWQALKDVQRDYVVNIRLLDAKGMEAAYWLGRPVRSGYPTNKWQAGQAVGDPWRLILPEDVPAGQYQVQIVIFDAATQQEVGRTLLPSKLTLTKPQP
jgi:Dolichyl-phosphate-mannose-protein mannosyltransferase